jgi:hypothetical protein
MHEEGLHRRHSWNWCGGVASTLVPIKAQAATTDPRPCTRTHASFFNTHTGGDDDDTAAPGATGLRRWTS